MAQEKQLSIIVQARDNATAVFNQVGNSAGGLTRRLEETGHGLHSQLRQIRNIGIAFELLPVGIDAAKAAFSTLHAAMTGSAKDAEAAVAGQMALRDGLRELPVVGKLAAGAATFFGDAVAKAFGKQTTTELAEEIKKKQEILKEFAETTKKLAEDVDKSNIDVSTINLTPPEAEIQKAKEKFAKQMDDLKAFKASIIKAGGEGQDVRQQLDQVKRIRDNAAAIEQADIAKAHATEVAEQTAFDDHVKDLAAKQAAQIAAINNEAQASLLQSENRGYEVRLILTHSKLEEQIAAIREAEAKTIAEYDKQAAAIQAAADNGDQKAIQRIKDITKAKLDAQHAAGSEMSAAYGANAQAENLDRVKEIQDAKLQSLQIEAQAGDAVAKVQLDRLRTSKEQEATENALQAILHDERAAEEQKQSAYAQYVELKKAEQQIDGGILQNNEITILEKSAALGDETARLKLQQLQSTKELTAQEAQLNAIIKDGNATDQQRLEAQEQITKLKQLQQATTDKGNQDTTQDATLFVLQQEASLGDKIAERQLKKLQVEKEYAEQRQKILAISQAENASEASRANAKKLLGALDSSQAAVEKGIDAGDKKNNKDEVQLASLNDDFYMTGVAAKQEQPQDQMSAVVDANKETADTMKMLLAFFQDVYKNQGNKQIVPIR